MAGVAARPRRPLFYDTLQGSGYRVSRTNAMMAIMRSRPPILILTIRDMEAMTRGQVRAALPNL
jgi:hypothetical protein